MCKDQINLERDCGAPIERLWQVFFQPALWWGEDIVLEPVSGGKFYEPWHDSSGQHHTHGHVMAIEVPCLLVLNWWDEDWSFETEVTFRFFSLEQGSRVSLGHTGWQTAPEPQQQSLIAAHRQGWEYHLGNLVTCAEQQA